MLSQAAPLLGATAPFEVVLINPYEPGRQPFALAEPWYCCAEPIDQQIQSF